MSTFEYRGRRLQIIEFSDLSVDGMVFECWEGEVDGDQTLLFSLIEHEGKVMLKVSEPAIDLALLEEVVRMVEFTPQFRGAAEDDRG